MKNKDLIVGIPFTGCEYKSEVPCTREDEAIAFAAGARMAGLKEPPLVFMQNSGLGLSIDVITSLIIPYEINVRLFVSHRKHPEHHKSMGEISKKILDLMSFEEL